MGLKQWIGGKLQQASRQLLSSEQAGPIASLVRNPYGGHPAAGLTPDRLAQILRSSIVGFPERYLELAEDMEERFPQYGSVLGTRKRQVSHLEFKVVPASEDEADKQEAALVERVIRSGAFRKSKIDQLDAIGKGFSCVEMRWDTVAGAERKGELWLPVEFERRDPRFFKFDQVNPEHLRLVREGGVEELIEHKWLVHRAKAKSGLTIRGGLARQAAFLYLFQAFNNKDWAIFAEAFGQPFKLGRVGQGASEDDKRRLMEALQNMGTDFAAVVPDSVRVEFIKTDITGSTDLYEKRAEFLERQISKIVLGQTGTTDGIEGGGYALGKVHNDVRGDIQDADAEQWAATLNEQLVPPIIMFNFPVRSRKGLPEILIGRPEEEDVKAWTENVARLVPMGLMVSMAEAQTKIGVTPPKAGDAILVSKAPAAPSSGLLPANDDVEPPPKKTVAAALLTGEASATAEHLAVDALARDAEARSAEATDLILDLLAGILAQSKDMEDVRVRLLAFQPNMPTEKLAAALRQAAVVARLSGRADLLDDNPDG